MAPTRVPGSVMTALPEWLEAGLLGVAALIYLAARQLAVPDLPRMLLGGRLGLRAAQPRLLALLIGRAGRIVRRAALRQGDALLLQLVRQPGTQRGAPHLLLEVVEVGPAVQHGESRQQHE